VSPQITETDALYVLDFVSVKMYKDALKIEKSSKFWDGWTTVAKQTVVDPADPADI